MMISVPKPQTFKIWPVKFLNKLLDTFHIYSFIPEIHCTLGHSTLVSRLSMCMWDTPLPPCPVLFHLSAIHPLRQIPQKYPPYLFSLP